MTVKSIRDLLGEHPFFADLRPSDLDFIAGCGRNVVFEGGDRILREGGPADHFYVIRSGRVAVETHHPTRGGLVLDTLGAGDVLGWSWLFPPHTWSFDARAVDETHAVSLDGTCLRAKCDEDPRLGYALMQRFAGIMVQRLEATRLRLLDLYGTAA